MQPFAWERLKSRCYYYFPCCSDNAASFAMQHGAMEIGRGEDSSIKGDRSQKSSLSGFENKNSMTVPILQPMYEYMDEDELTRKIELMGGEGEGDNEEAYYDARSSQASGVPGHLWQTLDEEFS